MAAYAALVSVMQILRQIESHPSPPISLDKQQLDSLTEIVTFLQEFLEGYNSPMADTDEADPLEIRIADAAYAVEDLIESKIVDQILSTQSQCEKINSTKLYEGLRKVIVDMDLIKKEVTKMVPEKALVQDELQRQVSASASLSRLNNNIMVGFDDICLEIMDRLIAGQHNRQVIPIVGMGGIAKTTLAKNIYAQPLIIEHFDICAWVTISQQYNTQQILSDLLSQANIESSSRVMGDELGLELHKHLWGRRFLIVLDDMWSVEAWDKIRQFFPDNNNHSRIMVTTRLSNLGCLLADNYSFEMELLDEESSWNMLSKVVFGGGSCPLELEKIGKNIVESCRGLPLSIVVVGGVLEKLERTEECWESIRRNLNSLVNSEINEHCLKILKLSYNHLPVYLKPCFLYMGVFEEDCSIRVSTLIKLWISEGFVVPKSDMGFETTANEYMKELIDRNLILVDKLGSTGNVKYCKIHDLLRDLSLRESHRERFYHVVGKHSPQSTNSKRCIVIPEYTSSDEVRNAIGSATYPRSCISENERVPLLHNLRLLRTLKACVENLYGYQYPLRKMFELVNLRFLAVRVDENAIFPSSINLLWSIQTLIVSSPIGSNIHARIDIWKMPQLRHVEFHNFKLCLPDPPSDNIVIMENLQALIGITNLMFDEGVVRRIPNIKNLGLLNEEDERSKSNDDCLHKIECLHKLESFSCKYTRFDDNWNKLSFPHSLKKLNLFMYVGDIEDMLVKIGSLPLLQKLSLTLGGFRTRTWEVVEGQFPSLKVLSVCGIFDLVNWMTESSPFPCLEHLHLYELVDLKEIPMEIGEIPTLKSVVLDNCSVSAVKSMKRIVEVQEDFQGEDLAFKVQVFMWEENEEIHKLIQELVNPNFQCSIGSSYDRILRNL